MLEAALASLAPPAKGRGGKSQGVAKKLQGGAATPRGAAGMGAQG